MNNHSEIRPVVEAEEIIATCAPPDNGAGPLWAYGSPMLVRIGERVYTSVMETGEGRLPLCNTRWRLFSRRDGDAGWNLVCAAEDFREREPCPLIGLADGRLFLSVNPINESGAQSGRCIPHLLEFAPSDFLTPPPSHSSTPSPRHPITPTPLHPEWKDGGTFTEHSYRGIAADGEEGEIFALNIDAPSGDQFWSFRDVAGTWRRQGRIAFPIRSCYPQTALRHRAGHVLAIGDIVEPVEAWRKYKFEQTQRTWDYVFRILYYTWTPDISRADFSGSIEVENVDGTAGHIGNFDLWLAPNGDAHLLYRVTPVQSALMRDRFFPGLSLTQTLVHAVVRHGDVIQRTELLKGGEGVSSEVPGWARFHATPDGRLFVVYHCGGSVSENRLMRILPEVGEPATIPFQEPFGMLFTATERGGSQPSETLDVFGIGRDGTVLRYGKARIA